MWTPAAARIHSHPAILDLPLCACLATLMQTQPDLAIMAVNTFVKDSQDPNPLIRALAVRTMGCIRVDKITEYLCDPLHRCLKVGARGFRWVHC